MKEQFSLKDIKVYQESLQSVKDIIQLCNNPSLKKEYWLCDQIKRASISVCINIAEGYGRKTNKDFGQFLSISLGSCNEVLALIDVIKLIYPEIDTDILTQRYRLLSKRIYSFRRNLR